MNELIKIILKELTGAPEEFQLLPHGRIEIEGEDPAWLDENAAQAIIAEFERRGNDKVIDYEHQTLKDIQAPAAGWIKRMIWKGVEGLWVVCDWTQRAKDYIESKEYRYFSPVFWVTKGDRKVVRIDNVALTNDPKVNNLKPIMAKHGRLQHINPAQEDAMWEKLKKLLGLANDADENAVIAAAEAVVAKNTKLEARVTEIEGAQTVVACKEVLTALGAQETASKDEVVAVIASLKAPDGVAVKLSHRVAELENIIATNTRDGLVDQALKEGKTSPKELDDWGRDLAAKSPEQFKKIVLSRPAGSVIPIDSIKVGGDRTGEIPDDLQREVNKQMGVDDETFTKYNPC